ncbi:9871_t:CDS:2, partial [Racocetra fulgida]
VGDMITIEKHISSTLSPLNDTSETLKTPTIITKSYSDDDLRRLPKKIAKRIENFRPRSSQLDREQLESAQDPFRGFFTLFWIAMGFYVIQTWSKNFESAGILFELSFFRLFSQDAICLILSDAAMIGSMFFAVLLQKLIAMQYSTLLGESKKSDNASENPAQLDELKEKIAQVEGYLSGPTNTTNYPNNITFMNFVDFLLVPTLVYELEYPRTE